MMKELIKVFRISLRKEFPPVDPVSEAIREAHSANKRAFEEANKAIERLLERIDANEKQKEHAA